MGLRRPLPSPPGISPRACRNLCTCARGYAAAGTRLDVLSLGGTFGFGSPQRPLSRATGGRILLLAAGIGVTPFVSMLRGAPSGSMVPAHVPHPT